MNPVDRAGCPATNHGTRWTYERRGCTCPDAKAAARRDYRERSRRLPRIGRERGGRRPGGDIDPIAVALACAGDQKVRLNTAEMTAAVAVLTRAGKPARECARILNVSVRTVNRHRAHAGNGATT